MITHFNVFYITVVILIPFLDFSVKIIVMETSGNNSRTTKENTYRRETISSKTTQLTERTTNWSRFSEWVHCVCVVTFDLELGQAIEIIYPEEFTPSEQEKTNICYLAFPDSNSGCMGDTQFHVRLRLAPDINKSDFKKSLSFQQKKFNSECLTVYKADKAHYWGFVYFRQRKESSLPRGYFQKSLIILTRLPFFNLFYEMLSQLAPKYFRDGLSVIETACKQICSWPALNAGDSLSLPFYNVVYHTIIPQTNSKCGNNSSNNSTGSISRHLENSQFYAGGSALQSKTIASVNELDIFRSLSCIIPHVYTLWELVLTAEPIVVIGASPADTSHLVQSLVSLIAPLEYCAEFRPYFTIHDSEFKEFTREYAQFAAPPSIIIGVTNPFFIKLLKDWPHMIRISINDSQINCTTSAMKLESPRTFALEPNVGGPYSTNNINLSKRLNPADDVSCVITKYKPYLKKDKTLIKKILIGINTKRPEHVQSALLKRSFLELTQSFMIPLERYMASLMPLQKDISPFKSAPNPHQFKQDDFLSTLEQSGPHLTSPLKGNWKGLYKRFFSSPNFKGWYETRHKELQKTLQALQLQALSGADLNQWAQGKQEVEIIDMIIKLRQKLKLYSADSSDEHVIRNEIAHHNNELMVSDQYNETRRQLLRQIDSMKQSLPDDLKSILYNT